MQTANFAMSAKILWFKSGGEPQGFLFPGKKVDRRGAPWRVLTMF
jgi:hypothetical protein